MSDDEQRLTRPSAWAVIKASALHRLGKPLLLTYLALVVFGLLVVLGSVAWMRFGPLTLATLSEVAPGPTAPRVQQSLAFAANVRGPTNREQRP